jgi:thiamine biosynthesis lipoprotein
MGTLVSIQVQAHDAMQDVGRALDDAFAVIERISSVMSAHDGQSDLGRMSRASSGQVLTLDPHTVQVIQASQHWARHSRGAFNPAFAGWVLAQRGGRPGLTWRASSATQMAALQIVSAQQVRVDAPVALDLGGVAKGYALDQAATVLMRHGCRQALINGGGDLRVLGDRRWPIDVRHAGAFLRDRRLSEMRCLGEGGIATSVRDSQATAFIATVAGGGWPWRSATVVARDCMTSDILTKWALQSSRLCPSLGAALRSHGARMWRT